MLIIKPSMVKDGIYAGPDSGLEDVPVTILSGNTRVIFPLGMDIKALVTPPDTTVVFLKTTKVRHLRGAGRILALENLFIADMDYNGDIGVAGNFATWISGINLKNGNFCCFGQSSIAGSVRVLDGSVYAGGGMTSEGDIRTLDYWAPKVGSLGGMMAQLTAKAIEREMAAIGAILGDRARAAS